MTNRIDLLLDRIQQRLYLIRELQIKNDKDRAEVARIEKGGKDV